MAKKARAKARKPQQIVRRPVDDSDDWNNTSPNCQDDDIQVIFNNARGRRKEISFHIVNRGTCPVRLGVTSSRQGGAIDKLSQRIPGGAKERVSMTIPRGHFLKATCTGQSEDGCNWTISDLKC